MEEKCKTGDLCNGRVLSADTGIPDVQLQDLDMDQESEKDMNSLL